MLPCFVVLLFHCYIIDPFPFPSSSEKVQALHTELDSVQALRGQLEEVLARTRNMALKLERTAKRPPDLGGGDEHGPPSMLTKGLVTNNV